MNAAADQLNADLGVWGPQGQGPRATDADARAWVNALVRGRAGVGTGYGHPPVVSGLLAGPQDDQAAAVYAVCQRAQDLALHARSPEQALEWLAWWRAELHRGFAGDAHHPAWVALAPVIAARGLQQADFDDLIDALEQDQQVSRYADLPQLLDHCARRANPAGRIALRLHGVYDAPRARWMDATCTGLQLTHAWQHVRRDALEHGRVYVPADVAARHGLDLEVMVRQMKLEAALACGVGCPAPRVGGGGGGAAELLPAYRAVMRELVGAAREHVQAGRELWPHVPRELRGRLRAATLGGEAVLKAIGRRGFDSYTARPRVGPVCKAWVRVRMMLG